MDNVERLLAIVKRRILQWCSLTHRSRTRIPSNAKLTKLTRDLLLINRGAVKSCLLLDYLALPRDCLRFVLRNEMCEENLNAFVLNDDVFIYNRAALLHKLRAFTSDSRDGAAATLNIVDVSSRLTNGPVLLADDDGSTVHNTARRLLSQIAAHVGNSDRMDIALSKACGDGHICYCTLYGALIGYPYSYYVTGDAHCLEQGPVTHYVVEICAGDASAPHPLYEFTVPQCIPGHAQGVASWFQALATFDQRLKLTSKHVTTSSLLQL